MSNFPYELLDAPQWGVYKLEEPEGKVPYSPIDGRRASSTDSSAWTTYAQALGKYQSGSYDGLGFVFTESDSFAGIDIDDAFDTDGSLKPAAQAIVDTLNSYTERSPSGMGVHIIVKGVEPQPAAKKHYNGLKSVELYSNGRYFTMTGDHFPGTPTTVEDRGAEYTALRILVQPIPSEPTTLTEWHSREVDPLTDDELIEKARNAKNGDKFSRLFDHGDKTEYGGDNSRATLGLCTMLAFYAGHDGHRQVDRIFRQSKMMRAKWDSKRGDSTWGQKEVLKAYGNKTEFFKGHLVPLKKSRPGKRPPTELGNSERFADEYSHRLRFVSELRAWIEYKGSRFKFIPEERAFQLMKSIVRCIDCEVINAENEAERDALRKWAMQSEKKSVIANSLSLAEKDERISILAGDLDLGPWLVTVQNGTIDLRTGQLRESSPADLITKQIPVLYDPKAECPRWLAFLERVIPDTDLRRYCQKAFGYSLTGLTTEQVLFFLYGPGANGKSKFIGVLEALLCDYWSKMRADLLMLSRNGPNRGATPELVHLKGKRIVTVSEIQNGHRLDEALIKDLTGGDAITARDLYARPITFLPTFKIWMYGNHKPNIGNTDEGIWRRPKMIPFLEVIPREERDPNLSEKLLAELPGILNWTLEGCQLWQQEGLGDPTVIADATQEYRQEQDILGTFLSEMCLVRSDVKVKAAALYEVYKLWCKDNTVLTHSGIKFGKSLTERGFGATTPSGVRYRTGLELTNEAINRAGLNSDSND